MPEIIHRSTPMDRTTCPKAYTFSFSGRKLVSDPQFSFASPQENDDCPDIILTGQIIQCLNTKKQQLF